MDKQQTMRVMVRKDKRKREQKSRPTASKN